MHFYTLTKIRESKQFIISKRIKYLGINLHKEAKYFYSENCKTLMKEIKDDTNRGKYIPCSWTGRINTVKMTILFKVIYIFSATPVKLPMAFFTKLVQKFVKFIYKYKRPRIAKAKSKKENRAGRSRLPDSIFHFYPHCARVSIFHILISMCLLDF